MIKPEQSNSPGPAAPQTYGVPSRVNAACTATEPSPPPAPGDGSAAIARISFGGPDSGAASGAGAAGIAGGKAAGPARVARCRAVRSAYRDFTAAICT